MWREISTVEEWNEILQQSAERGQVILKHSTRCPVSSSALEEYEQYLHGTPSSNVDYTLVKVIESRPVSNKIAEDLNLKHESPQIIFIKDGEKYWSATHWSISSKHMKAVLE
ncbi:MAG: bacillithiol system redox-active protein YtxJ [Paenibacillaceae bacterium]|uniref:bacillithiol system redox-active protein YtxJ n=1 Tax=Paenibacillus cymbidii TaxID=1639034 RepID=UPI00108095D3|nr:bacillithiol system redox-active protein YtxJ [Paenibacillus cymbidii]MBO9610718.1 bacillithiol system redox-active protein YtxJ [Paenibacillaceae bacterium]